MTVDTGGQTLTVLGSLHETRDVNALLSDLSQQRPTLPFAEETTQFLADFSRRLSKRARGDGGSQALAFWLRPAELRRLQAEFENLNGPDALLMPRGLVFHVPPANVDSIFVYSMALSLLTGNKNIVRMSSRVLAAPNVVLDTMVEILSDHPQVAASNVLVSYGHQDEITAALSEACDVRVIWGGDGTVDRIRQHPLRPHARDITFPDRFSLAAIGTAAYESLPDDDRNVLAEKFFNDTFWFDQMGCSSPRSLVWVGERDHVSAAGDFHRRLSETAARKGYAPDAGVALSKINQAFADMIDQPVTAYQHVSAADTVLETDGLVAIRGEFCGGGIIYQTRVSRLGELVGSLERRDQTLAVYGIAHGEIVSLVTHLAGTAIDRVVPIGTALNFGRSWDGYDLLQEFTRRVVVDV